MASILAVNQPIAYDVANAPGGYSYRVYMNGWIEILDGPYGPAEKLIPPTSTAGGAIMADLRAGRGKAVPAGSLTAGSGSGSSGSGSSGAPSYAPPAPSRSTPRTSTVVTATSGRQSLPSAPGAADVAPSTQGPRPFASFLNALPGVVQSFAPAVGTLVSELDAGRRNTSAWTAGQIAKKQQQLAATSDPVKRARLAGELRALQSQAAAYTATTQAATAQLGQELTVDAGPTVPPWMIGVGVGTVGLFALALTLRK